MSTDFASGAAQKPTPTPRILFLDDDPARAEVFLAMIPEAVWVQTADECIARLAEEWDEVHLDHDLGGEHYVDLSRDDCGMEVVRWLCLQPHPHLKQTRFLIHSHNAVAAGIMVMQIHAAGFQVESRPFGSRAGDHPAATGPGSRTGSPSLADVPVWNHRPRWQEWTGAARDWTRRLLGLKSRSSLRSDRGRTDLSLRPGPVPEPARTLPRRRAPRYRMVSLVGSVTTRVAVPYRRTFGRRPCV